MKIRAKIKGTGQMVEGYLVAIDEEPLLFCRIKNNISLDKRKSCIYGIYKDTIQFFINDGWWNFTDGMVHLIEHNGKGSLPAGIVSYFQSKIRGQKEEANNIGGVMPG